MSWPTLVDSIDFECRTHQLRAVDHLWGCYTSLLIEGILNKFLLQPEVLTFLLSSTLALLIDWIVHDAQFAHLCLLLVLHLNVLEDDFASANVTLVPLIFFFQEVFSVMLNLLQTFISRLKSLHILRPVVINRLIDPFCNFFWFCSLSIKLVYGVQTKGILTLFTLFFVLLPVVSLRLKLRPALVFDCIDSARVKLTLVLYFLLNCL